ncbi:secreted RxLR effector peptide protein, putative [Phytophthora infestans T30-4]
MTVEAIRKVPFNSFMLFPVVFLLVCAGAGFVLSTASNQSFVSNEALNCAVGVKPNRRLRMQTWSANDKEYGRPEERVNVKVPGVEKLKGLIKSGTANLEKIASRAKTRLASNNKKAAELSAGEAESKRIASALAYSVPNNNPQKAAEDIVSKRSIGAMESSALSVDNINNHKAREDIVAKLGVEAVEAKRTDSALTRPVTNIIVHRRPELSDEAFMSELTAKYGDEALTKLLVEAQNPKASKVATMVNLSSWIRGLVKRKRRENSTNI